MSCSHIAVDLILYFVGTTSVV